VGSFFWIYEASLQQVKMLSCTGRTYSTSWPAPPANNLW
jgi:hypothetical protein